MVIPASSAAADTAATSDPAAPGSTAPSDVPGGADQEEQRVTVQGSRGTVPLVPWLVFHQPIDRAFDRFAIAVEQSLLRANQGKAHALGQRLDVVRVQVLGRVHHFGLFFGDSSQFDVGESLDVEKERIERRHKAAAFISENDHKAVDAAGG